MTYSFLLFIVGVICFPFAFPKVLLSIHKYFSHLFVASPKTFLLTSRILAAFFAVFLFSFADPAHAQFYTSTEGWLKTQFSGGNAGIGTSITIIFNVLRALFVIYLGIALVRIVVAARNDDDWQQLARIPLILVLAVTLGDQLAKIITG